MHCLEPWLFRPAPLRTITIAPIIITPRVRVGMHSERNEERMKLRNALLAVFGFVLLAGMATPADAQYHHHHHRHHHHHYH